MYDNRYRSISHLALSMQFEWDEGKNLANIRKHKIDFADVPENV